MQEIDLQRRRWLSLGGLLLGASILPNFANAALSTPKPLSLRLRNINTGETLVAAYTNSGFGKNTLTKLNYIMRDRRTNQVHRIDPKLFVKLTQIQAKLGMRNAEVLIISGYRSQKTNTSMRRASRGVASNSYHTRGQAVDFRIDNIALAKIKAAAESLNNGGVGFYPRSNFIHVDTGPARTWRGI